MASSSRKPGRMDFQALYQDSLQLTSGIEESGIPTLQRGIDQFHESSSTSTHRTGTNANDAALNKAHFLLAGRGFDAEKLTRELHSIELKASYEPLEPLGDTDIEGYLRHHHDMIVVTAIEVAKKITMDACERTMNNYMEEEWELSKSMLLEDLGQRRGSYETTRFAGGNALQASTAMLPPSSRTRKREELYPTPSQIFSRGGDVGFGFGTASSVREPGSVRSASTAPSTASKHRSEMDSFMIQYANVIRDVNQTRAQNHTRNSFDLIGKFVKISKQSVSQLVSYSKPADTYRSWELLRSILTGGQLTGTDGASLEENAYEEMTNEGRMDEVMEMKFAAGARKYLENQFRMHIEKMVDQSRTPRAMNHESRLVSYVKLFVELKFRSANGTQLIAVKDSVWPEAYYCLRAGGCEDALSLLRCETNYECYDALMRAMEHYVSHRNVPDKSNVQSFVPLSTALPDIYTALHQRFQQLKSRSSLSTTDTFEMFTLNLVLFENANLNDALICATIEDFMWQRLAFIVPFASKGAAGSSRMSSSSSSSSSSKKLFSLTDLQDLILKFGSKHFDQNGKNPMVYFHVLLLTCQFERAMEYIISFGYMKEVFHMILCLDYYAVLNTFPSTELGTSNFRRSSSHSILRSNDQCKNRPFFNFCLLLNQYVHQFSSSDPRFAIEYAMMLRNRRERMDLIVEMVLDTRDWKLFMGHMEPIGHRVEGLLDKYLEKDEVFDICKMCGRICENKGDLEDAVKIYITIGEILQLLSILNVQLGEVLCPPHSHRELWCTLALNITETYFKQPWVSVKVQQHESYGLTFQALLNLAKFFDLMASKNWRTAVEFMDFLELLPKSMNGITEFVEQMYAYDTPVRNHTHNILLGYMTCLLHLSKEMKGKRGKFGPNGASGTSNGSILTSDRIRERAQVVVSFAGMLKFKLPEGTNERLNRMEVLFI